MKGPRWTKEEMDHALELVGDYPLKSVEQRYNLWAQSKRLPKRSAEAIKTMAYEQGIHVLSVGEWVNAGQLSLMLNSSYPRVAYWINKGWLPYKNFSNGRRFPYVSRTDLRIFARKRPDLFAGISESALALAFSDERLAKQIAEAYPVHKHGPHPVIQVETGKCFPTISAAAKSVFVTHRAITLAIKNGRTSGGYHWRYAQDAYQQERAA